MEEFFRIEIPPLLLLVLVAILAAIYFYTVRKYGDLADFEAEVAGAGRVDAVALSPVGIDRKKRVAVIAAAVAVVNKNKTERNRSGTI